MLGIHPCKVPQALDPALTKVAKLILADSLETWGDLYVMMRRLEEENNRCLTVFGMACYAA